MQSRKENILAPAKRLSSAGIWIAAVDLKSGTGVGPGWGPFCVNYQSHVKA